MPEAGFTAPPAQGPVPEQGLQATPNRRHIEGIDAHRRVAAHFHQRRDVRRQHRRATRHRLDDRQAESLNQGRVGHDRRRVVQGHQLPLVDLAEAAHGLGPVRGEDGLLLPAAVPHQHQGRAALQVRFELRVRLDQAGDVLARLERADRQDERTSDPEAIPESSFRGRQLLPLQRDERRRRRRVDHLHALGR